MTPKARRSAGTGKTKAALMPPPVLRATRIVATIGPRAERPEYLVGLVKAGADLLRINGAHARRGEITRRVALIRTVEKTVGRPIGVLLDLGGPKIRVGPLEAEAVTWKNGDLIEIVPGSGLGTAKRIFITYPALLSDVHPGAEIRIDDGKIRLLVESRTSGSLGAKVLTGGVVRTGKGVNFPGSALSAPALTAKDRRDLAEAIEAGVDFVGLSFVRSARQVEHLRGLIDPHPEPKRPWIVAKIERPEAVADLAAIAQASDALMVARGDLGVEVGLAAVPRLQRRILEAGRRAAVPVIVATQMLESMIENATPTRAEVSDVAGAVHDGADAVMLSGETAMGKFPEEAVRTMADIAMTAELPDSSDSPPKARIPAGDFSSIVADAAVRAAASAQAAAIVVYTESGRTARLVSKAHLPIPVFAITTSDHVRRRMTILRNVFSGKIARARSVEEMLRAGDEVLAKIALLQGRTIVEVSGAAYAEGATNTVRVRLVGPTRT
jgi:pyruvate kinase